MDDELLTMNEAAERSGRRTATLRSAAIRGTLKARKFGRDWMVAPADLDAYIEHANATQRGKHNVKPSPMTQHDAPHDRHPEGTRPEDQ